MKNLTGAAERTNQTELGVAASEAMESFDKLAKDTKIVTSQVPNLLTQQEILTGAKAVGISVQLAITSGLNVYKSPGDNTALAEASVRVADSLKDLLNLTQTASASSGIKDLESAKRSITQTLAGYDTTQANQKAGATDVLKAAKGIADSVVTIYTSATSGEDVTKLIAACGDIKKNAENLLRDAKGAVRLTDPESGRKLTEACKSALQATTGFLDATKAQRKAPTPDTQKAISEGTYSFWLTFTNCM